MILEVVGSNPTTHPTLFILGCSQVGKAPDFDSGIFAGSSPVSPATLRGSHSADKQSLIHGPLAQSAEPLTFNQGVRSSNLRWFTNQKHSVRSAFLVGEPCEALYIGHLDKSRALP